MRAASMVWTASLKRIWPVNADAEITALLSIISPFLLKGGIEARDKQEINTRNR